MSRRLHGVSESLELRVARDRIALFLGQDLIGVCYICHPTRAGQADCVDAR